MEEEHAAAVPPPELGPDADADNHHQEPPVEVQDPVEVVLAQFGITLSSVSDDEMRALFVRYAHNIAETTNNIVALHDLKAMYRNDGAELFDKEDVQGVDDEIVAQTGKLEALKDELGRYSTVFQANVVHLEAILTRRRELLNDADERTGVLTRNPRLLHAIAHKQSKLTRLLAETKQRMLSRRDDDWGGSRSPSPVGRSRSRSPSPSSPPSSSSPIPRRRY